MRRRMWKKKGKEDQDKQKKVEGLEIENI